MSCGQSQCSFGSQISASAQSNAGQISGTVTDTTGAIIPTASVRAQNQSTGSVYTAVSTGTGSYSFPTLAIGIYKVTVTAPGFSTLTDNGVVVQIGTTTPLNLKLSVGETTSTIDVNASASSVQTQSSDVGGVITTKQIEELPLVLGGLGQLRAIECFVFLVPGTVGPRTATAAQGSGAAEAAAIYLSKLGGGQNFGAQVLLDGISTQREENVSTFDEISPSVEAITEFKVTTSTPQAEYGRTSGGIEAFLTKSGRNTYHGTLYDIFRNTALDANNWFSAGYLAECNIDPNSAQCRQLNGRAVDQKNDYGVDLGSPVRIPRLYNGTDKLFFFFSFEQFRKNQATTTSTVPTALERVGNFTQILQANGTPTGQTNPCTGAENLNGEILTPIQASARKQLVSATVTA